MALAQSRNFTPTGRNQPERVGGMSAQSSLLRILGARPQLGRLSSPDEDVPGKPPVVILMLSGSGYSTRIPVSSARA
jgi:hypothetical protein